MGKRGGFLVLLPCTNHRDISTLTQTSPMTHPAAVLTLAGSLEINRGEIPAPRSTTGAERELSKKVQQINAVSGVA